MTTEFTSSDIRSEILVTPITDTTAHPPVEGTKIVFHRASPPVVMQVFPGEVSIMAGKSFIEMTGTPSLTWSGEGVHIQTHDDDEEGSQAFISRQGEVVFSNEPARDGPNLLQDVLFARSHRPIDWEELFADVDIDNPETFGKLTYGQIVRYFRDREGLTLEALAARTEGQLTPNSIIRLEQGDIKRPRSPGVYPEAFGVKENSPEYHIFKNAFKRERARSREKRAAKQ
ncbi:MAG: hypothetical protein ACREHC_06220 [Candidatus Levyibacteriota bacterium]